MIWLASAGAGSSLARTLQVFDEQRDKDRSGWVKYVGNPVLGGHYGTCFDVCVLHEAGSYRMWVSWRPKKSVALTESTDGIHWSPPEIVLPPRPETGWEDDINRPTVVRRHDGYHMWYTGQAKGHSYIGYATGPDGRKWVRQWLHPVVEASAPWEGVAVMCPDVMWHSESGIWKMWYSGGQQYEPNAIGYATSHDGLHWDKYAANPVMKADPRYPWEKDRVTAAQILRWQGWYYAFYIGFRDINHAQIGMARSRDGITNWVRNAGNPVIRPTPGGWDADACYKPFAIYSHGRWMLWYNGRHNHFEQIGLVFHYGEDLGFVPA
jgi:beta-1,2-mannobiose phosphorylase / 1,2-beta-oligomannan phosphorylase